MSNQDENGDERKLVVERMRQAIQEREQQQLQDMLQDFPALRGFLVGLTPDGQPFPSGTISVSRGALGVVCTLRIPNLLLEAKYSVDNWSTLWSLVEDDLAHQRMQWQNDWKYNQREAQRWQGV